MTHISKTETAINNLSLSIPNIELLLSKVNTKQSFHEFIKQSWPAIEGGVRFVDSWHIQAIAEHLRELGKNVRKCGIRLYHICYMPYRGYFL